MSRVSGGSLEEGSKGRSRWQQAVRLGAGTRMMLRKLKSHQTVTFDLQTAGPGHGAEAGDAEGDQEGAAGGSR